MNEAIKHIYHKATSLGLYLVLTGDTITVYAGQDRETILSVLKWDGGIFQCELVPDLALDLIDSIKARFGEAKIHPIYEGPYDEIRKKHVTFKRHETVKRKRELQEIEEDHVTFKRHETVKRKRELQEIEEDHL